MDRIEGEGVRRVKRPMEIRTVFVAPLTIFTCYRMIVCSRYIGDFEDRWKTKPGRGRKAKGKKDQSFGRSLCLDYTNYMWTCMSFVKIIFRERWSNIDRRSHASTAIAVVHERSTMNVCGNYYCNYGEFFKRLMRVILRMWKNRIQNTLLGISMIRCVILFPAFIMYMYLLAWY